MGLSPSDVTFLMTDVEGSTALWESDPAGTAKAIARHAVFVRRSAESADHDTVELQPEAVRVAGRLPEGDDVPAGISGAVETTLRTVGKCSRMPSALISRV